MKKLTHVLFLALLVAGCASTDEIILDNAKRPQTTSVEVFKDGKKPDSKYKVIAELTFLGARDEELKAQKHFMEKARKLGGDAVLFWVVMGGQKSGGSMYGYHTSVEWVFKGKVVSYEK